MGLAGFNGGCETPLDSTWAVQQIIIKKLTHKGMIV